jgi:uncharacterized protein YndB with AHSA1/START domain
MATSWLPTTLHEVVAFGNREVADGTQRRRRAMTDEVHEETIGAEPADVWGFMVDPAALSAWFGADAWLEPAVDAPVIFRFADSSIRRGVVEQVERSRRLTWRWREQRGAGFAREFGEPLRVTIELEPVPEGTRVRITEAPVIAASARGTA